MFNGCVELAEGSYSVADLRFSIGNTSNPCQESTSPARKMKYWAAQKSFADRTDGTSFVYPLSSWSSWCKMYKPKDVEGLLALLVYHICIRSWKCFISQTMVCQWLVKLEDWETMDQEPPVEERDGIYIITGLYILVGGLEHEFYCFIYWE